MQVELPQAVGTQLCNDVVPCMDVLLKPDYTVRGTLTLDHDRRVHAASPVAELESGASILVQQLQIWGGCGGIVSGGLWSRSPHAYQLDIEHLEREGLFPTMVLTNPLVWALTWAQTAVEPAGVAARCKALMADWIELVSSMWLGENSMRFLSLDLAASLDTDQFVPTTDALSWPGGWRSELFRATSSGELHLLQRLFSAGKSLESNSHVLDGLAAVQDMLRAKAAEGVN